jgi:c-di-GMP-binding flagellar brake protein YcgR
MLEKRKHVRIPERLKIACKTGSSIAAEGSLTKDISLGGIRFALRQFIPKDSLLKVRLTFDKMAFSFVTYVKVVWIKKEAYNDKYVIGAKFEGLQKENLGYLSRHIASRLTWAS